MSFIHHVSLLIRRIYLPWKIPRNRSASSRGKYEFC